MWDFLIFSLLYLREFVKNSIENWSLTLPIEINWSIDDYTVGRLYHADFKIDYFIVSIWNRHGKIIFLYQFEIRAFF